MENDTSRSAFQGSVTIPVPISYNRNRYGNDRLDETEQQGPDGLLQSGGAQGDYSDRSLPEERLSGALRSDMPEESMDIKEVTNSKQSCIEKRNTSRGRGR